MNPYVVLGVSQNATDDEIRQAYLKEIRKSPPEHNPDRFKMLTWAYGMIKDKASRSQFYLFDDDPGGDSLVEALIRHVQCGPVPRPLDFESMKDFLRTCAKI